MTTATATRPGVRVTTIGKVSIAYAPGNLRNSKDFANAQGGRLLLDQREFIRVMKANPELPDILDGRWFWLSGKSTKPFGYYKVGDEDFVKVTEQEWNTLPSEERAYVWIADPEAKERENTLCMITVRRGGGDKKLALYNGCGSAGVAQVIVFTKEPAEAQVLRP